MSQDIGTPKFFWRESPTFCVGATAIFAFFLGGITAGWQANSHGRSQGREEATRELQHQAASLGYGEYVVSSPRGGTDDQIVFQWRCIDGGVVRGWKP